MDQDAQQAEGRGAAGRRVDVRATGRPVDVRADGRVTGALRVRRGKRRVSVLRGGAMSIRLEGVICNLIFSRHLGMSNR